MVLALFYYEIVSGQSLRNLHFVDNLNVAQETKDSDRVWKIRPWITGLRDNFLNVSPEEFLSVDES